MAVSFGGGMSLLVLIAIGTSAAVAAPVARPFAVPVDFDAPAGCSDVDSFRRGVATRLATRPERSAGEADVAAGITRLQIRIVRVGAKVQGELRLIGQQGATDTRRVEGTRCQEVVEVLALTTAMALEPAAGRPPAPAREARAAPAPPARRAAPRDAPSARPAVAARDTGAPAPGAGAPPSRPASSSPPPRPAPVATPVRTVADDGRSPVPPPSPSPQPPTAAAPPAVGAKAKVDADTDADADAIRDGARDGRGPLRLRAEAGAGAALAHVLAPGFNLGGALMLGLTRQAELGLAPSLRLVFLYLPDDLLLPAGDVTATWRALALSACPGWGIRSGPFQAQACARVTGGWLAVTDRAVENPRAGSRTVWSAGAFLRGAGAIGAGFSVELEAGVDATLVERRFITTTPLRTVANTPAVSVLVGLGLSRKL